MCSFRTLSCGNKAMGQMPGEQRLATSKSDRTLMFRGVSARLRGVKEGTTYHRQSTVAQLILQRVLYHLILHTIIQSEH